MASVSLTAQSLALWACSCAQLAHGSRTLEQRRGLSLLLYSRGFQGRHLLDCWYEHAFWDFVYLALVEVVYKEVFLTQIFCLLLGNFPSFCKI